MAEQLGLFDSRWLQPADAAAPPLCVRESRRARRLTLRVLPPYTLELVVPRGTPAARVASFVHEHRHWIERARREIAAHYPLAEQRLPTRVALRAIDQAWTVRYEQHARAPARVRTLGEVLEVRTRDTGPRDAEAALRAWLCDLAHYHLTPWVLREAVLVDRRPSRVQVRLQRTRWGSCSSSGTLSLNAALLFLDPAVVRYLLIHELCHLISLNHSRKFWTAVARYEPDFEVLDRRLTAAWADIPLWAHPDARRR
ncbi:MAG TPA: SprT family zinc-dependent metalloprotease [Gammaproteobacteria bacterium]|nr:SprT family zinc-dependent metalloprotease [Gammaproteobacteria bacterium]